MTKLHIDRSLLSNSIHRKKGYFTKLWNQAKQSSKQYKTNRQMQVCMRKKQRHRGLVWKCQLRRKPN